MPRSAIPNRGRHNWQRITPWALECTRCHHPQRVPGPPVRPAEVTDTLAALDPARASSKKASQCPGAPHLFLHYEGQTYHYQPGE